MQKCTKNRKTRVAPIPGSLQAELEERLGTHESQLIFPLQKGRVYHRNSRQMSAVIDRAREAAKIPDLTSRMCRATFATLFDGNIRDGPGDPVHTPVPIRRRFRSAPWGRSRRWISGFRIWSRSRSGWTKLAESSTTVHATQGLTGENT